MVGMKLAGRFRDPSEGDRRNLDAPAASRLCLGGRGGGPTGDVAGLRKADGVRHLQGEDDFAGRPLQGNFVHERKPEDRLIKGPRMDFDCSRTIEAPGLSCLIVTSVFLDPR